MVLTRRPGKECSPFVCNEVTRTGSYSCCGKFIFFRRAWTDRQLLLLREVHLLQEGLEAGVGAEGVVVRFRGAGQCVQLGWVN